VIYLGGTRVLLHTVTMDDRQCVEFLRTVQPRTAAVPVHYEDYRVMRSPLLDFLRTAGREGLADRLRVPRRGETIELARRSPRRS
jgi:hypothetical protein